MNSNEKQKEYWTNSAGNLWVKDKSEKDNMLEPLGNYALSKFNILQLLIPCDLIIEVDKISEDPSLFILNIAHVLAIIDIFLVLNKIVASSSSDESGIAIDKLNN